MNQSNSVSARALNQAMEKARNQTVSAPEAKAKTPSVTPSQSPEAPVANKALFDRVSQRHAPAKDPVGDTAHLESGIDGTPSLKLQQNADQIPRPKGLERSVSLRNLEPLCNRSDNEFIEALMKGVGDKGKSRFGDINRGAAAIAASGVLADFRQLETRNIQVPASEYDRSIADDAVLVMKDLAKLSPQQIASMKDQAFKHPEFAAEHQGAIDKKYYGSAKHKEFGALVERLTGGVLSAEEAMSMCPCGGIPGDGHREIPLASSIAPVARHAMRHDALGFLLTRFGVGPGYGSPTTPFGLNSSEPMAGQILGIAREVLREASVMPESGHVAKPERFKG